MGTLSARILVTFCQNVGCFLLEYKTLAARIYVFFHIRSIIYTMWLVHIQKNVFANWCHEKRVAVYCVMLQGVDVCCRVLMCVAGCWCVLQGVDVCCRVLMCVAGSWCVLQGLAAWNMSPSVFVWRRRAHPSHRATVWLQRVTWVREIKFQAHARTHPTNSWSAFSFGVAVHIRVMWPLFGGFAFSL